MAGKGGEVREVYTQSTMAPESGAIFAVEMCKRNNGQFVIVDCDTMNGIGTDLHVNDSAVINSVLHDSPPISARSLF